MTMNDITVSVITVTFNAKDCIQRTLDSVLMQTYAGVEHIIMDGASSDGTADIARRYRDAHPDRRIVVVSEPDKGLYDAMNKAMTVASGTYLCFLNAGDKLHSASSLEEVVGVAAGDVRHGLAGVVYGNTDIVDAEGVRLRARRLAPPEKLTSRSFGNGMLVCHQAFYVNKEICLPYDLNYRFSADFDWCIRVMEKAESKGMPLAYTRTVLADYLAEGMTTANHKASLVERFKIMVKHYGLVSTVLHHVWFVVRAVVRR